MPDDTAADRIRSPMPHPWADENADQAVADLYQTHYRPLVRLAALLVSDLATAEEIVQDSFAAGQRVALRRFHLGNVAEFVAYRSSEQVTRFQSWDAPYPREAGERLVRRMMNRRPDTPGMAGLPIAGHPGSPGQGAAAARCSRCARS